MIRTQWVSVSLPSFAHPRNHTGIPSFLVATCVAIPRMNSRYLDGSSTRKYGIHRAMCSRKSISLWTSKETTILPSFSFRKISWRGPW